MKIVRKVEKVVVEDATVAAAKNTCWYAVIASTGKLLALHYSPHAASQSVEEYKHAGYDCHIKLIHEREITL